MVLTRSYYAKHEKKFNKYLTEHPSTQYDGEDARLKKQSQVNRNILLSKINANMLIKCDAGIDAEKVAALQQYKDDSYRFDSTKAGYSELVEVDFSEYDIVAGEDGKLPEI